MVLDMPIGKSIIEICIFGFAIITFSFGIIHQIKDLTKKYCEQTEFNKKFEKKLEDFEIKFDKKIEDFYKRFENFKKENTDQLTDIKVTMAFIKAQFAKEI